MPRRRHRVSINGITRDLPLFKVAKGTQIAIFNLLGDTEITQAASRGLADKLVDVGAEILVTAETKSVALTYQLALDMGLPWVVLRKSYRPYMGRAESAETLSITTGTAQTLYLDEKDAAKVAGARVVLVDDVISTGSTLNAMRSLVDRAGGEIVAVAAVFTEGKDEQDGIVTLGHLPLFQDPAV